MTRLLPSVIATLATLAIPVPSAASMDLEMVRHIREVRAAVPSPDGRSAAVVVAMAAIEGGRNRVWVGSADGRPARAVGSPDDDQRNSEWTADGRRLLVLASGASGRRLLRIDLATQSVERLQVRSAGEGGIGLRWGVDVDDGADIDVLRFASSPDGSRLAVIVADRRTSDRHPDDRGNDARVVRDEAHAPQRLLLASLRDMSVRALPMPDPVMSFAWRRDGMAIAIVTGSESDADGYRGAAWMATTSGGLVPVAGVVTTVRDAVWTADGLAYIARCEEDAPPECAELFRVDAKGRSTGLTRGLEGSLSGGLSVTADGRNVVTLGTFGLEQLPVSISLRDGRVRRAPFAMSAVGSLSGSADGQRWAVVSRGSGVQRVHVLPRWSGTASSVTLPGLLPPGWPTSTPTRVEWRRGGLRLEGVLFLPKTLPGQRVPLVTWVHGGPYGSFAARSYNLADVLVAEGWAVFLPNPRGSSGRGAAFARANRGDLGGGDLADILAGIDAVAGRFEVDTARMAMIGYSYGGTMSAFTAGRSDRFRAFVAGAPVVNQVSEFGTEDSSFDDRWYLGDPTRDLLDAWKQSPLSTAHSVKAPVLILQGDADDVDPPSQAAELRRALLNAGVDVTLVRYPREDHGSLAAAFGMGSTREPWHSLDIATRMTTFLHTALDREHAEAKPMEQPRSGSQPEADPPSS